MFFFPYIVARWHPLYVFALYSPFSFPWSGLCLSAVLAGLAPTQQRTSSSERGGLLGWGEGNQAQSYQSWQSFQSSGQFLQLGMRRLWIFSTCHVQTWVGRRLLCFPQGPSTTSVLWENPCIWGSECNDSCKKCVRCDSVHFVHFEQVHCHVQDAVTKFSKNLNFTEGLQIFPFKVHVRCLSPCSQCAGLPGEHTLSQDMCSDTGTVQMTPSYPGCLQHHDQPGLCQGKWLGSVLFFYFGRELVCTVLFLMYRGAVKWCNLR